MNAAAELFMQLFMQGTAPQGWAVCCCFCSGTLHRGASAGTRGLGSCGSSVRSPGDGKVLPFLLWRVQGLSQRLCVTRVAPGHGKWDINKAKAKAEPLTYLQMLLLGLFVSVIAQSTLGDAGLLLPGIS